MATLMRYLRNMCLVLDPKQTVRISRCVRRITLSSCSQCSRLINERVDNADPAFVNKNSQERSAGQKRGDKATTSNRVTNLIFRLPRLNEVDGLWYEKAYPGDKILSCLVNLARSKKLREQQGKIVLEGKHLITDALLAGAVPCTVFFNTKEKLQELPLNKLNQARLIKVKLEDLRIQSDLDAPKDLIAVFRRPDASQMYFSEKKYGKALPLILICDNVRDPGNLAATLHCAAAAGCHSVLLTKGCADIWEPKLLRIAMRVHFQLPIIPSLKWTDIHTLLPANTTVHVADSCRGITSEHEFSATLQPQKKLHDSGWFSSQHGDRTSHYSDDEDFSEKVPYDEKRCWQTGPILERQPYHISWASRHTAVVIGGETHGLSKEALQMADLTGGRRLLIPMVHGMDSLNSAMAASVLLFEGRRQLMLVTE